MTKTIINAKKLRRLGACQSGINQFLEIFGNEIKLNKKSCDDFIYLKNELALYGFKHWDWVFQKIYDMTPPEIKDKNYSCLNGLVTDVPSYTDLIIQDSTLKFFTPPKDRVIYGLISRSGLSHSSMGLKAMNIVLSTFYKTENGFFEKSSINETRFVWMKDSGFANCVINYCIFDHLENTSFEDCMVWISDFTKIEHPIVFNQCAITSCRFEGDLSLLHFIGCVGDIHKYKGANVYENYYEYNQKIRGLRGGNKSL